MTIPIYASQYFFFFSKLLQSWWCDIYRALYQTNMITCFCRTKTAALHISLFCHRFYLYHKLQLLWLRYCTWPYCDFGYMAISLHSFWEHPKPIACFSCWAPQTSEHPSWNVKHPSLQPYHVCTASCFFVCHILFCPLPKHIVNLIRTVFIKTRWTKKNKENSTGAVQWVSHSHRCNYF